jgi:hypothetical protein
MLVVKEFIRPRHSATIFRLAKRDYRRFSSTFLRMTRRESLIRFAFAARDRFFKLLSHFRYAQQGFAFVRQDEEQAGVRFCCQYQSLLYALWFGPATGGSPAPGPDRFHGAGCFA